MKKHSFFMFLGILVITTLGIALFSGTRPMIVHVAAVEKSNNYVFTSDEQVMVSFELYVSSKHAYIVTNDWITAVVLHDEKEENSLRLDCVDVIPTNEQIRHHQYQYQKYQFLCTSSIQFEQETFLEWENARIRIDYQEYPSIILSIGSFGLYIIPYFGSTTSAIGLERVRAIVNNVDSKKTIVALDLTIRNHSQELLEILSIELLDPNAWLLHSQKERLEFNYYPQGTSLDTIIGKRISILGNKEEISFQETIIQQDRKQWIIPVVYQQYIPLDRVGFRMQFRLGDAIFWYYQDAFTFFETVHSSFPTDVVVHTYENRPMY